MSDFDSIDKTLAAMTLGSEQKKRPTIEELETILNSEKECPIQILPNGELTVSKERDFLRNIAPLLVEVAKAADAWLVDVQVRSHLEASFSSAERCRIALAALKAAAPEGT
jgi:hypothetical protein